MAHRPEVQLLQALRPRVNKGGGEGRVIGLHHQVAAEAGRSPSAIRAIGQLEVGHLITDAQGRVRVQGDGWDLKDLISETGSVVGLLKVTRQKEKSLHAGGEHGCDVGAVLLRSLRGKGRGEERGSGQSRAERRCGETHRGGQEGVARPADGQVTIAAFWKLKQVVGQPSVIQATSCCPFLSNTSWRELEPRYLVLLGVSPVSLAVQELRVNVLGATIRKFRVKIKVHSRAIVAK